VKPFFLARRDALACALLFVLCTTFWWRVLFTNEVLLPNYLGGFAPFGSDPNAPWNLLRWDSLGQYFPWRYFAASELAQGRIPLWNPHQFAGTPLLANGQSAVFYPLSLPFWLFDTARAFGLSAWLHSLLAAFGTYFLARRWQFSRASSVLCAVIFAFSGYLTTWVSLPTLSNTASWLPLLLLLFERARADESTSRDSIVFGIAFACALLAGHPQIFFYCGVALALRALLCPQPGRALGVLGKGSLLCLSLAAIQLLPMLELARVGHRAAQGGASAAGWGFVKNNALPPSDYLSLLFPGGPSLSFSENFGYIGVVAALLAIAVVVFGMIGVIRGKSPSSEWGFSTVLAVFGLLYALATPLAQGFYFAVPGLAQMGGTGRAFILWTLGVALLAAFALELLRAKVRSNSTVLSCGVLVLLSLELFAANWNVQPTAAREAIYPQTELLTFLQEQTKGGGRILFLTPRQSWLPSEALREGTHPRGVLPPNGATIYGLNDVNGYDSLAPLSYRNFVADGENAPVSPPLNGNMILLENIESPSLDQLDVRWVVSEKALDSQSLGDYKKIDNCFVYSRNVGDSPKLSGLDFAPGVRDGQYQPQSFRLGAFISLCTLALCAFVWSAHHKKS
jgi:hypothetical protein